jgi:hypothetical protein
MEIGRKASFFRYGRGTLIEFWRIIAIAYIMRL